MVHRRKFGRAFSARLFVFIGYASVSIGQFDFVHMHKIMWAVGEFL
jgi:hypothetical protein